MISMQTTTTLASDNSFVIRPRYGIRIIINSLLIELAHFNCISWNSLLGWFWSRTIFVFDLVYDQFLIVFIFMPCLVAPCRWWKTNQNTHYRVYHSWSYLSSVMIHLNRMNHYLFSLLVLKRVLCFRGVYHIPHPYQ